MGENRQIWGGYDAYGGRKRKIYSTSGEVAVLF
jgi:hypothetical protein